MPIAALPLPTKIVAGYGALDNLPTLVKGLGRRALLVFGRSFARRFGYVDKLRKLVESAGLEVVVYEGVEPNPKASQCDEIASIAREKGVDVFVAFGGGSVIDATKAAAIVATLGGKTADYFYPRIVSEPLPPIIAIPTTCGTGSEVTRYAVITDESGRKKLTIVGSSLVPRIAILDPSILKHLPKNLLIWTALDAFSHALEAYVSSKATVLSDIIALRSIQTIIKSLEVALRGEDRALEELHIASMMAGMAINITGTNLVHAMGYYLTARHGVHHGLGNAVVMPVAMELLFRVMPREKLLELAKIMNSEAAEPSALARKLAEFESKLGIPRSFRELGFDPNELSEYVEDVLSYRRNLENAPMTIDKRIVEELARKLIEGW